MDSGHPDAAARAAVNLGLLLEDRGDTEGARTAYRRAIDSGHPDAAPMAARNLGVLLEGRESPAAVLCRGLHSGPAHVRTASLGRCMLAVPG
jgi:Flp pilus assembly protein TadD